MDRDIFASPFRSRVTLRLASATLEMPLCGDMPPYGPCGRNEVLCNGMCFPQCPSGTTMNSRCMCETISVSGTSSILGTDEQNTEAYIKLNNPVNEVDIE